MTKSKTVKFCNGFALIEVLVAASIASIIVLSIYSGLTTGAASISRNAKLTRAILIAQMKMSEFRLNGMRGLDVVREDVREYPEFTFSRTTERFESSIFAMIPSKKMTITVEWSDRNKYSLYTVYIDK